MPFLFHLLLSYFSLSFCGQSQVETVERQNCRIVNSLVVYFGIRDRNCISTLGAESSSSKPPRPVLSFNCSLHILLSPILPLLLFKHSITSLLDMYCGSSLSRTSCSSMNTDRDSSEQFVACRCFSSIATGTTTELVMINKC